VFKGQPAPRNLTVPPYAISTDAKVVIGVDEAAKTA
jgi:Rieske Fe-S protein